MLLYTLALVGAFVVAVIDAMMLTARPVTPEDGTRCDLLHRHRI